jgi:hypothetical protein
MDEDFLVINNKKIDNIDITNTKEKDGEIFIKQYSGLNTENFILKKKSGPSLHISIFKLNGIFYININGEHIIDYKRFKNIHFITQSNDDIILKNSYFGQLKITNCDIDIIKKGLFIISEWMKKKTSFFNEIYYFLFS